MNFCIHARMAGGTAALHPPHLFIFILGLNCYPPPALAVRG